MTPDAESRHSPAVAPKLIVRDAVAAIAFYRRVFGATESLRLTDPDGKVVHAELAIGGASLMVGEETPDAGNRAPVAAGDSPVHVHLYVADVDAVAARAVEAGARVLIPVADQFYGDRAGRLLDPFGHVWVVATRLEELTPEQIQQRFDAFLRAMQGG